MGPGKYDLISLRKVNTKFGNFVIAKLDGEEKEYYLAKKHGDLSIEAIDKISKGKYKSNYIGYIDGKYEYKLEHVL